MHSVGFWWACDKQLRDAVTDFAADSRRANPWAADLYPRARARGHDHSHAIRILARAWLYVIWHCWQQQSPTTRPNTEPCKPSSPAKNLPLDTGLLIGAAPASRQPSSSLLARGCGRRRSRRRGQADTSVASFRVVLQFVSYGLEQRVGGVALDPPGRHPR